MNIFKRTIIVPKKVILISLAPKLFISFIKNDRIATFFRERLLQTFSGFLDRIFIQSFLYLFLDQPISLIFPGVSRKWQPWTYYYSGVKISYGYWAVLHAHLYLCALFTCIGPLLTRCGNNLRPFFHSYIGAVNRVIDGAYICHFCHVIVDLVYGICTSLGGERKKKLAIFNFIRNKNFSWFYRKFLTKNTKI